MSCRDLRIRGTEDGFLDIRMCLVDIRCLRAETTVTKAEAPVGWVVTVAVEPYDGAPMRVSGVVTGFDVDPGLGDIVEDVTPRLSDLSRAVSEGLARTWSYLVLVHTVRDENIVGRYGTKEAAVAEAKAYCAHMSEGDGRENRVMAVRVDRDYYLYGDVAEILWDSADPGAEVTE